MPLSATVQAVTLVVNGRLRSLGASREACPGRQPYRTHNSPLQSYVTPLASCPRLTAFF
jgi:hypothetical protein